MPLVKQRRRQPGASVVGDEMEDVVMGKMDKVVVGWRGERPSLMYAEADYGGLA